MNEEQYDEEFRRKHPELFRNYRKEPVTAETIKTEAEKPFKDTAQVLATASKLGIAYQTAVRGDAIRRRYQQFTFRGGDDPLVDVSTIPTKPKNSTNLVKELDGYFPSGDLPTPIQTAQRRMGMQFGEFGVLGKKLKGEILDGDMEKRRMEWAREDALEGFPVMTDRGKVNSKFNPYLSHSERKYHWVELPTAKELKRRGQLGPRWEHIDAEKPKKPKRTKGKLTTPERIKGRIERGAPVYTGQPVPDIEDLAHAAKGPGFEKTWERYDRSSVEGFSKELETHLQNKFGGSDSQMEAFKFVQTSAKKQAKILKDEMNKKSQFDFLSFALTATDPDVPKSKRLDIEDIHTLAQVMSDKPRSANLYDRGHNISAKNIARHEKQPTTSDYASNIDPAEIKGSIRDFIPTTKGIDTLRIKEVGNIKKGARKDLPQPIQTLKGVSRNIEEEYVRFLNPEIDQAILRIPQEAWGEMLKYIRDGFDVKRSAGFSSFQDYLDDRGITRSQYDSFTKKSQDKLTAKFNKQKKFVIGKQQLDQQREWIRELADDYLQKYTYEVETGIKKINPQLQYLEKYFPLDE